ncbi:type II toxin-antitoxin system VapC family toxin [Microbacterium sp. KUDC0406]|uniref:type II toxin-antitoxin system VapC family toxin n=1 Tax=Microbacterium sp. KUDC0406 TaxID=2909588 RepID=UPI001F32A7AD|nr:type II toxin-antitoxin system VapC family toxin [Microbacterium sp. KUDC0406]UJP09405.1 type II toxin-antitoxin system VapC family toxin [Microbacterium sp. KUDC0406]
MIYLDTSAAAKALLDEDGSADVRALIASGAEFVSSRLLAVELHAVADRRLLDAAAVQELLDRVALVSLDDETAATAITMHSRLRTLDALHLATAVRIRGVVDSILTFDAEMRAAAVAAGIPSRD